MSTLLKTKTICSGARFQLFRLTVVSKERATFHSSLLASKLASSSTVLTSSGFHFNFSSTVSKRAKGIVLQLNRLQQISNHQLKLETICEI